MPIRMLLVDDIDDVRLLMRIVFDLDDRFEVVGEAANGVEAVELTRSLTPDAVLLDLMMPVMDGFAAIPGILQAAPEVRIIAYSGMTAEAGQPALAAGAVAFVEKGVSPSAIAGVVYDACR